MNKFKNVMQGSASVIEIFVTSNSLSHTLTYHHCDYVDQFKYHYC